MTGTPQITLETGTTDRTVNYSSGSGSNTLTFTYTVQAGDTSSDLDYVATNSLALNSGTIRDAAGNNATLTLPTPGAANSLGNNKAITIDGTPPTVTSVSSSTANGSYKTGDNIAITVAFSESVTVTGTPQITLETGTTDRTVNYSSGSGSNTLTFTYTVQAGDTSSDLDYVATNSLALNSGTIRDAAGNNATLTLPTPGAANSLGNNKAITIDGTPPTVTSVSSSTANGSYKTGDNIAITVAFSESVTVTGTPQITLETGTTDRTVNYSSGSGSNTLTFTYTVQAGDTSSDLDYVATNSLALNSGTIADTAGNNATLTLATPGAANSLGNNKTIVIDSSAPSVIEILTSQNNTTYKAGDKFSVFVQFTESVNITGVPQLTLETGTNDAVVDYKATSSSTVEFEYTVRVGDTSADLDIISASALSLNGGTIKDVAGNDATLTLPFGTNSNSLASLRNIIIDGVPPTFENSTPSVSSITQTGFTLSTDINESGIVYYVVVADGATAPTPAEVKAGTGNGGSGQVTSNNQAVTTGGFTNNFNITGLTLGTAYDVYVIAEDTAGNIQASVEKIDVSILQQPLLTFADINATYGDANFDLQATSNSAGTISYSIQGANTTGTILSGINNQNVNLGTVGTVTIRATQAANGSFTSATKDITLTISQKAITVTAQNQSKIYGNTLTLDVTAFIITGLVNGDTAASLGFNSATITSTGGLDANSNTAAATYTGNLVISGFSNSNYNISYVNGDLIVNEKAITITADAKSKVYGQADPIFTYKITAGTLEAGDVINGTLSRTPGEDAGIYGISSKLSSSNYNITFRSAFFYIIEKEITITADAKSKVYGDDDPTLTYQITAGSLETGDELSGNLSRVAGENVGTYTIASTLANSNYDITFVNANLTITKANQTITFDELIHNEDVFTLTATASSGLAVSYTSSDTSIATIDGNIVTILKPGSLTITASQAGNENFEAAQDVSQTLNVMTLSTSDIVFTQNSVAIYPNPAIQSFKIDLNVENTNVSIFDITGKLIKSIENYTPAKAINISNLKVGTYLIRIKSDNKMITKRLVKTK